MATVRIPKLYTPTREVWLLVAGGNAQPGEILWCHGNRRSTLGGYIGTFNRTYPHHNKTGEVVGYSPNGGEPFQIHMDNVTALPDGGPLKFA